jgi:hypothetical protein
MRAILLSEFWMALVYASYLVYPNVYVLAAAIALHGFWFPVSGSAIGAYLYALIPDRLLGRAMAAVMMLSGASAPLGPVAAGLLLTHTSPRLAVITFVAPVVIAALLGTASPTLRDLPSLAAAPAAAG